MKEGSKFRTVNVCNRNFDGQFLKIIFKERLRYKLGSKLEF